MIQMPQSVSQMHFEVTSRLSVFSKRNQQLRAKTGAAAFGDWHNDAPGIRRLITVRDLPEIGKDGPDYAEIVPRPAGAMPQVPDGFSVELVASGLAQARVC